MASPIRHGTMYYFGQGYDVSLLPQGWTMEESQGDWVIAKDPDGNEYYVSETEATPRKVATYARGCLAIGDYYSDTANAIKL